MQELQPLETLKERKTAFSKNMDARIISLQESLSQDNTSYHQKIYTQIINDEKISLRLLFAEDHEISTRLIDDLLSFHIHEVRGNGENFGLRKDCLSVAQKALSHFSQSKYNDILACEVFSAVCDTRNSSGYGYHAINIFEIWPPETDEAYDEDTPEIESLFLAVDFTASYNMDADQGRYNVFAITSNDKEALEKALEMFN